MDSRFDGDDRGETDIGTDDINDLCPRCREELGVIKFLGFDFVKSLPEPPKSTLSRFFVLKTTDYMYLACCLARTCKKYPLQGKYGGLFDELQLGLFSVWMPDEIGGPRSFIFCDLGK